MRIGVIILLALILLHPAPAAEIGIGSICISPIPEKPTDFSAPGLLCESAKLSVKLDAQQPMAWPIKENVKMDALDLAAIHRVVVYCDGKPQQSFKFRFSEYKTKELCLFINDMYKTVQLWESKESPWCKCRKS